MRAATGTRHACRHGARILLRQPYSASRIAASAPLQAGSFILSLIKNPRIRFQTDPLPAATLFDRTH
jgi:hypothetical protein